MKLQHYRFMGADLALFSNTVLAPHRRKLIKFHNRLIRVASKLDLTVDEVYTIWYECIHAISSKEIFRYLIMDEKFRDTMIRRILKDEDK